MRTVLQKFNEALAPAIALVHLSPYLFEVRQDTDLHPVLRSYLSWMPLCLFSNPFLWLQMLLFTHSRFRKNYQRPYSFYIPHLSALPFSKPDQVSKFLEENVAVISEEFARVAPPEVVTPSKALVSKGVWNTFPLMRAAKNFRKTSITAQQPGQ